MSITMEQIKPKSVRYIKLGQGGMWERGCIRDGILRFGFGTGDPESFAICEAEDWDALAKSWRASGRTPGTATRFANETRLFYEAGPDDLWITFVGERMYWGFLEPGRPVKADNDDSSWRRIAGGWRSTDRSDVELNKSNLPGSITKLAAYRGTSCWADVHEQVVRRINAEVDPVALAARQALTALQEALVPLLRRLGDRDMEVLAELIFGASGWRRVDATGGTRKMVDLDLELPTTKERAFVQVKTSTRQSELDTYIEAKELESYSRMFYVYHTGDLVCDEPSITLVGPDKLAQMTIEAGLTDWVLRKIE